MIDSVCKRAKPRKRSATILHASQVVLPIALAVAAFQHTVLAEETDRERADAQFALLASHAPEYVIQREGAEDKFAFHAKPILRWSNPLRKARDGGVFLWTSEDRPAIVMCAYWREGFKFDHEFQSLHEEPVTVWLGNDAGWTPDEAGIRFQPAPDAPPVSPLRVARLAQMRKMVRRFDGTTGFVSKPLRPLRPLTQPLYRYPEDMKSEDVVDGGLFALVQSTDPEILVLFEAHKSSTQDEPQWRVAFARMSVVAQFVKQDEKVIWACNWGKPQDPKSTYFTWHFEEPKGIEKKQDSQ